MLFRRSSDSHVPVGIHLRTVFAFPANPLQTPVTCFRSKRMHSMLTATELSACALKTCTGISPVSLVQLNKIACPSVSSGSRDCHKSQLFIHLLLPILLHWLCLCQGICSLCGGQILAQASVLIARHKSALYSTNPYFTLILSSFSSMGSAPNHRNSQVAAA